LDPTNIKDTPQSGPLGSIRSGKKTPAAESSGASASTGTGTATWHSLPGVPGNAGEAKTLSSKMIECKS